MYRCTTPAQEWFSPIEDDFESIAEQAHMSLHTLTANANSGSNSVSSSLSGGESIPAQVFWEMSASVFFADQRVCCAV